MVRKGKPAQSLGRRGEQLAAQYLMARGWEVLERNWRCNEGEIDIIAVDPDGILVFVEVKTRSGLYYGHPLEGITLEKARRLRGLAVRWVREHAATTPRIRVDGVGVVLPPGGRPELRHLIGADPW
ncbi:YraN family protein [Tessaracoccus caeni]|uniref:YraN family protein n=1 Tax=Tessaracoccus caeni TaxID=3031239 RepID=UPI0023DC2C89|nr:YraN family protein [Tessaracoccus caeni]MDF1489811.1 YraN family protein [Tessaracoccus caeni]